MPGGPEQVEDPEASRTAAGVTAAPARSGPVDGHRPAPGTPSGGGDRVRSAARRFGWEPEAVCAIARGNINDSFVVTVSAGAEDQVVLQSLNRSVFGDPSGLTANGLAVCRHLGGHLVPVPVPATDGSWLVEVDGELWRAWLRMPGGVATPPLDPDTARSSGALLGRFHTDLAGLDPAVLSETLPGFHDPRGRLDALEAAVAEDRCGRLARSRRELERVRDYARIVALAEDLSARVPRRVAHFDCKLDNLLFQDGRAATLVDLDTVMPGAWFWDVGDLVRTASATVPEDTPEPDRAAVDRRLYDATLTGYLGAVPPGLLTEGELDAVPVAGAISAYEQAVRFLTDWLAGDVYFRTTRPGHNLDRARTQLALLDTMPRAVGRS